MGSKQTRYIYIVDEEEREKEREKERIKYMYHVPFPKQYWITQLLKDCSSLRKFTQHPTYDYHLIYKILSFLNIYPEGVLLTLENITLHREQLSYFGLNISSKSIIGLKYGEKHFQPLINFPESNNILRIEYNTTVLYKEILPHMLFENLIIKRKIILIEQLYEKYEKELSYYLVVCCPLIIGFLHKQYKVMIDVPERCRYNITRRYIRVHTILIDLLTKLKERSTHKVKAAKVFPKCHSQYIFIRTFKNTSYEILFT